MHIKNVNVYTLVLQVCLSSTVLSKLPDNVTSICVSGVSSSGKTYYAKNLLRKHLENEYNANVQIMFQDDYFLPFDQKEHTIYEINGEQILQLALENYSTYDNGKWWTEVAEAVRNAKFSRPRKLEKRKLVIIEGHKYFHAGAAMKHCDVMFDMEIEQDVGLERRMARKHLKNLFPLMGTAEYYLDIIWEKHVQYMSAARALAEREGRVIKGISNADLYKVSCLRVEGQNGCHGKDEEGLRDWIENTFA